MNMSTASVMERDGNLIHQIVKYYNKSNGKGSVPFFEFHKCIVANDIAIVKAVLSEITYEAYKHFIVNATVSYEEELCGVDGLVQFQLPLALAAGSGNTEMFTLLLEHGADVNLIDSSQRNIFHSLVTLCIEYPRRSCDMYQVLLANMEDKSVVLDLHQNCDADGLTALDLAAEYCVPEILQLILTTDQVYRFPVTEQGLSIKYEYRIPLSADMAFIHRLTAASKAQVDRLYSSRVFSQEPMKTMVSQMKKQYKTKMILLSCMMIGYILLYQCYLFTYLVTKELPPKVLTSILFSVSIVIQMMQLISLYTRSVWRHRIQRDIPRSHYVKNITFEIPSLCFGYFVIIVCILDFADVDNVYVQCSFHTMTASQSLASIIILFQLSDTFSHMTLMIGKMFEEMLKFLPFSLLSVSTFAMAFYVLHAAPRDTSDNNASHNATDNASLQEQFFTTFYDTFLMAFIGKMPDDLFFSDAIVPQLAIVCFPIVVLECPILLLNLLIAIFSHQVEDVYKYQIEIQNLIKINTVFDMREFDMFVTKVLMRKNLQTTEKAYVVVNTVERLLQPEFSM